MAVALIITLCAALAVAGVLGAARYVSTFWLYRGFATPRLARTVVVHRHGVTRSVRVIPASVQQITVASKVLGGYQDQVYVVLPPGYAAHPKQRYPVLYLLHGFPGYPSNFLTVGGVQNVEAELVAAAGPPMDLGPGHALPYAAGGSAWRLASAATDARVAAAVRADG